MRTPGDKTEVGIVLEERRVFENPFFGVISRVIETPAGVKRDPQLLWDRIGKKFAVAITTDAEGRFVLVEEPKYGVCRRMISVPVGTVKKDEPPLTTAKRELFEETGYISDNWYSSSAQPVLGFCDKIDGGEHHIFYAVNARQQRAPREEEQKVIVVSKEELLTKLIPSGRLEAMSIATLLMPR